MRRKKIATIQFNFFNWVFFLIKSNRFYMVSFSLKSHKELFFSNFLKLIDCFSAIPPTLAWRTNRKFAMMCRIVLIKRMNWIAHANTIATNAGNHHNLEWTSKFIYATITNNDFCIQTDLVIVYQPNSFATIKMTAHKAKMNPDALTTPNNHRNHHRGTHEVRPMKFWIFLSFC